jgi:DNA-binding NarL/FixJ family response regulator
MAERRFTCIIADDHSIVRAGLAAAFEAGLLADTEIELLAEAGNGIEAIELVKRHRPDLLLLDISMPMASGAEILADLMRWSPQTRIVVLSAVTSPGLLSELVSAGVHGLFGKGSDTAALFKALPLILRGGKAIDPDLVDVMRDVTPRAALTARERQTLNMVLAGKTNAEIAAVMGISPRTAEKHRAAMMAKLEVRSLAELMARALQDGLIEQQGLR